MLVHPQGGENEYGKRFVAEWTLALQITVSYIEFLNPVYPLACSRYAISYVQLIHSHTIS